MWISAKVPPKRKGCYLICIKDETKTAFFNGFSWRVNNTIIQNFNFKYLC